QPGSKRIGRQDFCFSLAVLLVLGSALESAGQTLTTPQVRHCCQAILASEKRDKHHIETASDRFEGRVETLLSPAPGSKGEWSLVVEDGATGELLYQLNADKYFVPASNLKLFTTALALAKLGADYRFHTTLETRGTISAEGVISGDIFLVGR